MPQHELLACAQCGCFAFSCFEDFAIRVNYYPYSICHVPDDAFVVKKLRDAGAVILAKLNMSEFASGATGDGAYSNKRKNPHKLSR